jgi:hypothetical protein
MDQIEDQIEERREDLPPNSPVVLLARLANAPA